MKFDHDCARQILITIEEQLPFNSHCTVSEIVKASNLKQFDSQSICYACQILTDGQLLNAKNLTPTHLGDVSRIYGLTFKGHEYLDNIRDQSVWKDTKKTIFSKVSTASLSIFSSVAAKVIEDKFKL